MIGGAPRKPWYERFGGISAGEPKQGIPVSTEFAAALDEIGVPKEAVYEEPYFNAPHVPDPDLVARLGSRLHASP